MFFIQFETVLTKRNKLNDLRLSRDSEVLFSIDIVLVVWVIVTFELILNSLNLLRHGINDSSPSIYRPSPEEAKKWATSFESVLKHKFGVQLFQDFLRSQYGEENLNFWLAVEEYKKADDNIRAEKARVIYEDYVSTLSPTEVS